MDTGTWYLHVTSTRSCHTPSCPSLPRADIKCENILLKPDQNADVSNRKMGLIAKVADFGLHVVRGEGEADWAVCLGCVADQREAPAMELCTGSFE